MATNYDLAADQKIARDVKDRVWELGRTAPTNSDFDTIFYDQYAAKYGYDHYAKLQTLFFDAQTGATTLQEYNLAINRFLTFVTPQNAKSNGSMSQAAWNMLKQLVDATNVPLPGGGDITQGDAQLRSRTPIFGGNDNSKERRQQDRALHRQQQKAYRRILLAVTRLINHVLDLYVTGCAPQAQKPDQFAVGALQKAGILKTMSGYPKGICHLEMHKNMTACIEKIVHGD